MGQNRRNKTFPLALDLGGWEVVVTVLTPETQQSEMLSQCCFKAVDHSMSASGLSYSPVLIRTVLSGHIFGPLLVSLSYALDYSSPMLLEQYTIRPISFKHLLDNELSIKFIK